MERAPVESWCCPEEERRQRLLEMSLMSRENGGREVTMGACM
eukprot:COSAG01_NODE_73876_length_234_cov_3.022222_1_plen_41_part_10